MCRYLLTPKGHFLFFLFVFKLFTPHFSVEQQYEKALNNSCLVSHRQRLNLLTRCNQDKCQWNVSLCVHFSLVRYSIFLGAPKITTEKFPYFPAARIRCRYNYRLSKRPSIREKQKF